MSWLADSVESLVAQGRTAELDPQDLEAIERQIDEWERKQCKSLYQFMQAAWEIVESRPFVGNWHLGCIAEHLQAVTEGQIQKLLINIPPGHSKSLAVATFWPMWEWGPMGRAWTRWFFTSYDQKLSIRDSMRCRMIIRSPWFQRLWGQQVQVMPDEDQKMFYRTTVGGWRMASSIGGHLLGEHPSRIVVDDPMNVEQVESDAERKSVLDWWDLTVPTRRIGGKASVTIIMQRLHEQDLAGYVLGEGDWTHLCFPLRFESDHPFISYSKAFDPRTEDGQLLSPNYYSEEQAKETERQLGRRLGLYGISGQLQQRPSPRSGGLFDYADFRIVNQESVPPTFDAVVRYWDKAGSEAAGKWTAGVLMAKKADRFYVLDVRRAQLHPMAVENLIDSVAEADERQFGLQVETWVEQEGGSGGKFQAQYTINRLRGRRVRAEPAMQSKQLRAEPWSAGVKAGAVLLKEGEWNAEFISEHCSFPTGKFSDQVDSGGGAYRKLALPDLIRVAAEDLAACTTLTGPVYDHQHPYTTAVAALTSDQFQKHAALVILGVNMQSGKLGLLHAKRWDPAVYHLGRIPIQELVKDTVRLCQALRVEGLVIDPKQSEVAGIEIARRGVYIVDYPMNPEHRRRVAERLLECAVGRLYELYPERDLFAEVTRLRIKTNVDGYTLEDTGDMGTPLGYGTAFAVATVWAYGTLLDFQNNPPEA